MTYCRIVDHIIAHNSVHTADANAVCPLLECIGAARSNVIVLNCLVGALEGSLGNVQT